MSQFKSRTDGSSRATLPARRYDQPRHSSSRFADGLEEYEQFQFNTAIVEQTKLKLLLPRAKPHSPKLVETDFRLFDLIKESEVQ